MSRSKQTFFLRISRFQKDYIYRQFYGLLLIFFCENNSPFKCNGNSAFFFRSIVSSCHVSNDFTETISNTYIIHRTELKTSVIRKPVLRFKNRWQVRTNHFLRGLIWYAWGLWQAFRSDFIDSQWKSISRLFFKTSRSRWRYYDALTDFWHNLLISDIILASFMSDFVRYVLKFLWIKMWKI